MITATNTSTEDRALRLLGSGLPPETVAASLGITASRISQLLSDENFAAQVADLRYQSLAKHNQRDEGYDEIEDTLMQRLKDCLPLMHRPMEILKAIQVINQAKRRGASTPEALTQKQSVIQLTLPIQILNQFKINSQGQAISVGEQSLITIQSGNLDSLLKGDSNGSPKQPPRISVGVQSNPAGAGARSEEEAITASQ